MSGVDLRGKTALVTGGYSGLGLETVRALVHAGVRVIAPARRPDVAREALTGLPVTMLPVNLSDLDSVNALADELLDGGISLDFAINTAAVMATPETRVGTGWELQLATNHLGHFLLINRIYPLLAADGGARVIAYSSVGHHMSDIHWEDLQLTRHYEKWQAYGQSKTATSLFAVELDRRGKGDGVRAFAVHPGGILTPLQRHLSVEEQTAFGWFDENGQVSPIFKSPSQGAATGLWAATNPSLDGLGGLYCEDVDVASVSTSADDHVRRGVRPYAVDPAAAVRLWEISARLTGNTAI